MSGRAEGAGFERCAWQPVPGAGGASVYAHVRRPDVLSCNSYLVEYPGWWALIDPGALPEQTAALCGLMAEREGGERKPLLLLATHCHYDHCREVGSHLERGARRAAFAAQEAGAEALALGDGRRTAAELYGEEMPAATAALRLLAAAECAEDGEREADFGGGAKIRIRTRREGGRIRQWLEPGGEGSIEVVACPGHSPDSVCYRIGELLFIGDLLLAHRPLVAGIAGWDNRRLSESLERTIELLEGGGVRWCCPGHGNPLPAGKALELLRRQRADAGRYDDLEAMDAARLFRAVDMALELADEAEEAFAAIAGRLLYVAERLEGLEEPEMAERCRGAMDMDAVDALLEAFRERCRAMSAGKVAAVSFAIEATGIVEKLKGIFPAEALLGVLPASMVNRARRLLLDFMGIAQGTRNMEEFVPVDFGDLPGEFERAWEAGPHYEEAGEPVGDGAETFAAELARRIGHPPRSRRPAARFGAGKNPPTHRVAVVRLADTLVQLLEWLGVAGATGAGVEAGGDGEVGTIEVRIEGWAGEETPRARKVFGSFEKRFALAGFAMERAGGGIVLKTSKVARAARGVD